MRQSSDNWYFNMLGIPSLSFNRMGFADGKGHTEGDVIDNCSPDGLAHIASFVENYGTTSMEVGVRVEAEPARGGARRHTTSAYLTFVALDDDLEPTPVPPLLCETEVDERREAQALIRREVRRERIERVGTWRPERRRHTDD